MRNVEIYHTIAEFIEEWREEGGSTQKILDALTDESLQQAVSMEGRTLGRMAWHIVTSMHEMLSRTGLTFETVKDESNVPSSAKEIADSYRQVNAAMIEAIQQQWTDESLKEVHDMYGMQWPNWLTLSILLKHQIHHRGQMTVLMRQAGLKVPGVFGPAREEWAQFGMEVPAV